MAIFHKRHNVTKRRKISFKTSYRFIDIFMTIFYSDSILNDEVKKNLTESFKIGQTGLSYKCVTMTQK